MDELSAIIISDTSSRSHHTIRNPFDKQDDFEKADILKSKLNYIFYLNIPYFMIFRVIFLLQKN